MSQSNDSPAPCADEEGHGKSTISVCDTLCPEARGHKKRNLATVTIVAPPTGKGKKNSWVWKVMQQFEPPIRKCSVRCSVEVSKYGKRQPCGALFAWSGSTGTSTLASHIKGLPSRLKPACCGRYDITVPLSDLKCRQVLFENDLRYTNSQRLVVLLV